MASIRRRRDLEQNFEEAYEAERLSELIVSGVRQLMDEQGLHASGLATRLGVSDARVSQMLSPGTNLTLQSLAALSVALGAQFDIAVSREPLAPQHATLDGHSESRVLEAR